MQYLSCQDGLWIAALDWKGISLHRVDSMVEMATCKLAFVIKWIFYTQWKWDLWKQQIIFLVMFNYLIVYSSLVSSTISFVLVVYLSTYIYSILLSDTFDSCMYCVTKQHGIIGSVLKTKLHTFNRFQLIKSHVVVFVQIAESQLEHNPPQMWLHGTKHKHKHK